MNSFPMARVAPEKADFRPALPLGSLPGVSGTHMTKMTYGEQLKHPFWQRKRLEVLQEAEFKCSCCYDGETTLHVHHKRYVKGRLAWEYPNDELAALCEACHETEHQRLVDFGRAVAVMTLDGAPWGFAEFVAVACGWSQPELDEGEALELAGGPGFEHALTVGSVARDLAYYGPKSWPIDSLRMLGDTEPDAEFLAGLTRLCVEARQRKDARMAARGLRFDEPPEAADLALGATEG